VITETYRGVRLSVRALNGKEWGHCQQRVNGFDFFISIDRDEANVMAQLKRDVDAAHERPESYPDYWRAV